MAKIIYETTLLVCSSCVIFTGTVSAVLLMLAWPNDRILGISTRLVISLCAVIVAIFSVGFVGTIAESIRALILYACLLVLFPVSVLVVEIILRLSSSSQIAAQSFSRPVFPTAESKPTPPMSTVIYSDSFISNSLSQGSSSYMSNPSSSPSYIGQESSFRKESVSASLSPPQNALHPSPSMLSPERVPSRFNLSSHSLLSANLASIATSQPVLPTNFYFLLKDGYSENRLTGEIAPSNKAHVHVQPDNQMNSSADVTLVGNRSVAISNTTTLSKNAFFKATHNFWSDIFTTSLSPLVQASVEYVLIGMLAFVLLQIGIAYLLASEIRSLRTELTMMVSVQLKNDEDDEQEMTNLENYVQSDGCCSQNHLFTCVESKQHQLSRVNKNEVTSFDCYTTQSDLPYEFGDTGQCPPSNTFMTGGEYCMVAFQQQSPALVQVHAANDSTQALVVNDHTNNSSTSFGSNYVSVIIDEQSTNKASQFASSSLTSKSNRRNRMGSFRVTFDAAPEYFEESQQQKGSYQEKLNEVPSTIERHSLNQSTPTNDQQQQPHQHYR